MVIHKGAHRLSSKCCNSYWLTGRAKSYAAKPEEHYSFVAGTARLILSWRIGHSTGKAGRVLLSQVNTKELKMKRKVSGVVALTAFIVLAGGGWHYLGAQMGGGMRPQQGQHQQQMGGTQRPPGMMGGGGAMVVYGKYIYVLMGPKLMRVDPVSMKVVKEAVIRGGRADEE